MPRCRTERCRDEPRSYEDGRSKSRANGTFIDSLSAYFHDSLMLDEMGLVRVGDVSGVSPFRRARIDRRSMWNGSLTRMTVRSP